MAILDSRSVPQKAPEGSETGESGGGGGGGYGALFDAGAGAAIRAAFASCCRHPTWALQYVMVK